MYKRIKLFFCDLINLFVTSTMPKVYEYIQASVLYNKCTIDNAHICSPQYNTIVYLVLCLYRSVQLFYQSTIATIRTTATKQRWPPAPLLSLQHQVAKGIEPGAAAAPAPAVVQGREVTVSHTHTPQIIISTRRDR